MQDVILASRAARRAPVFVLVQRRRCRRACEHPFVRSVLPPHGRRLSGVVDNAVYPVLVYDTLSKLFHIRCTAWQAYLIKVALAVVFALPNMFYIRTVGNMLLVAAAVVIMFGWLYADPVLTLGIVVILSRGAYNVLRESGHILLEGVPAGVNLAKIKSTLTEEVAGVDGVHHVHAWGLTAEKPLLTLHALIPENAQVQEVVGDIKRLLKERFDIEHSTIQVELGPCPDDQHGHAH